MEDHASTARMRSPEHVDQSAGESNVWLYIGCSVEVSCTNYTGSPDDTDLACMQSKCAAHLLLQLLEKLCHKMEVAKVVCAYLQLKVVLCELLRAVADSSIQDQDV